MNPRMTPVARCTQVAGLDAHEIMLGVSPGAEHERLLAMYRRLHGAAAAQTRIVAEIRDALNAGAAARAADLVIVLRRLLAADPTGEAKASPVRRRGRPVRHRLTWPATGVSPSVRAVAGHGQGQVVAWRRPSPDNQSVV